MTLTKPLAVLRKRREENGTVYKVAGVIRWKYIFKDRPRLLISKTKE